MIAGYEPAPRSPELSDRELADVIRAVEQLAGRQPWRAAFLDLYREELARREAARLRPDPPHRGPGPRPGARALSSRGASEP